jgi:hypothetical protein
MKNLSFASILFALLAGNAQATVDAFMTVKHGAAAIQRDGYCVIKRNMIGMIGIPPASILNGAFHSAPIMVEAMISEINGMQESNILTGVKPIYVNDEYRDLPNGRSELTYTMQLDVSEVTRNNEAKKAVELVKLAVVVISRNLAESFSQYKLNLEIIGLPRQDRSTGEKLHATTQWPYTRESPVIKAYEKELMLIGEGYELEDCF